MVINKEEYIAKVLSKCEEGTTLVSEYVNATTKITLKCPLGHLRYVTTNSIVSKNSGICCKECGGRSSTGKKSDTLVAEEFKLAGYEKLEEYKGALVPILARNIQCNHKYNVVPSKVSRGHNILCKECSPSRRGSYTNETFIKELESFGLYTDSYYNGMKVNIDVINKTCGHEYTINPGHLLYNNIGKVCPICSGLGSIKNRFFSKLLDNNIKLLEEYRTNTTNTSIKNVCGHIYTVMPGNLVSNDTGLVCRVCTPLSIVSKTEAEVVEYIQSIYSGWVIQSDRSILEGKELDIVLPDLGLAIEYNGSKWHSEDKKPINYHLDKTIAVEAFGYRLVHINDTEWLGKKEIVKSRLASILGKSTRVYARKLQVRSIEFPATFISTNHIQGVGSITKYNYGLFLNEELMAVMTFSASRFSNACTYELVRYCSKLNTTIVGGASKLLKAFTKDHGTSVLSYSDKRWSMGNLYSKLGFKFSHTSKPNYRYYKYKYNLSRYQCQKHLLKDMFPEVYQDALSESEIMKLAGYEKVYDCGNDVWTLN